jgi:site-specific DNA recombinase
VNLQKAEDNYYLTVNYLLQLASKAYDLFVSSEIEEKRQLLKLLLQNPTLDGKKVRFTLLKPFDTILNYADSQLWLRRLDSDQQPSP